MKCNKYGCNGEASMKPTLLIRVNKDDEPSQVELPLKLCPLCADSAEIDRLVPDQVWKRIEKTMVAVDRGRPDRSLNEIKFEEL